MSLSTVIKDIVSEEIKSIHCAFLAKVLSIKDGKAKIQPLGLIREYGGTAKKQAPLTNVHIASSVRNGVAVGDVVLCVCCDRNIDAALKGENALPPAGYHKQSDCVIASVVVGDYTYVPPDSGGSEVPTGTIILDCGNATI